MIRIKLDFSRSLATILLAFAFLTKFNGKELAWYYPYLLCAPLFISLAVYYINGHDFYEMKHDFYEMFFIFICPFLLALVYTFGLYLFVKSRISIGPRAISTTFQEVIIILFAFFLVYYFKNDAIEVLIDSTILSYIITLINALVKVGFDGVLKYFNTFMLKETNINVWFEAHGVGLSAGILIIYEFVYPHNRSIVKSLFIMLVILLCFKRIAILAIAVTFIIWVLTQRKHDYFKNLQMNMIMIGILVLCMVYVMLITKGTIYEIARNFGFNFINRKFLFAALAKYYNWSISFLGNGYGFTGKYLQSLVGTQAGSTTLNMTAIHSDILKTYIDLGFVGSVMWFFWYTCKIPQFLLKVGGENTKYIYCLVMSYTFITYATDNTSAYFVFRVLMYTLIIYGYYRAHVMDTIGKVRKVE